ncbi:MAG: BACON domain-containing protein [Bacteroidales bacterium]
MKTKSFLNSKSAGMIFSLMIISMFLMLSCDKEPEKGPPYFTIEGDPTGLSVNSAGKTESYVVRSNRPWQIVAKEGAEWARPFPDEGEDDGIFKIIVGENPTFYPRTMNFAFVVDGTEQPVLFRVDQEGNVPYIVVPAEASIPAVGGEFTIDVNSNVDWTYSLSDPGWLTEVSVTSSLITLSATENTSVDPRLVTMTVTATEFPAISETIVLTQSPGTVVLEENFDWIVYGNVVFYTTTGEKRYDLWTQEERDRGWESTVNTTSGSGNTPMLYARTGFVKLGKTGYGGDLISPPLSKLVGTQDVTVTFKAIPYKTAGGTMDDNILNVSVIGPGSVSQSQFIIDNWPSYPAENVTAYCIAMWDAPEAKRTFTVTGATAETQIKFLGNDYYLVGVGAGKNRIFLDDIKVEIIIP